MLAPWHAQDTAFSRGSKDSNHQNRAVEITAKLRRIEREVKIAY